MGTSDANDFVPLRERQTWENLPRPLSLQRISRNSPGENPLQTQLSDLVLKLQSLVREDGQDLVEYALVVALIAFAATAGMHTLASDINSAFSALGGKVTLA